MVNALEKYDPQIYELMRQEAARQSGSIRLIPSENYVSKAVMLASGSCLTNKYAEGYPGKRYYEGQQVTDMVESITRERAKKLFKADHANVQPHSGTQANLEVYASVLEPGATIDLQARQIDGYVVAAPLSQIAGAIEQLPVVRVFARVKDKLIRLRVKGDWADPPGKLVKKEPIKDLKESTVGFIQDVVKGSGQFGRGMLNRIGGLFKAKEDKSQ